MTVNGAGVHHYTFETEHFQNSRLDQVNEPQRKCATAFRPIRLRRLFFRTTKGLSSLIICRRVSTIIERMKSEKKTAAFGEEKHT